MGINFPQKIIRLEAEQRYSIEILFTWIFLRKCFAQKLGKDIQNKNFGFLENISPRSQARIFIDFFPQKKNRPIFSIENISPRIQADIFCRKMFAKKLGKIFPKKCFTDQLGKVFLWFYRLLYRKKTYSKTRQGFKKNARR